MLLGALSFPISESEPMGVRGIQSLLCSVHRKIRRLQTPHGFALMELFSLLMVSYRIQNQPPSSSLQSTF